MDMVVLPTMDRRQSCRDVDDMEPGDIHFYVGKHRLLKKYNK